MVTYTLTMQDEGDDSVVTFTQSTDWDDLHFLSLFFLRAAQAAGFNYLEQVKLAKGNGEEIGSPV